MMKRKPTTTAEELSKALENDPNFQASRRARDVKFEERRVRLRAEEEPILKDLRELGYDLKSVWDFVNSQNYYDNAIPILIKHLQLPYSDVVRGGLARSLAVPAARSEWSTLISLFQNEPAAEVGKVSEVKDGLAVTLSVLSSDKVIEEIIKLAMDGENGSSRILLLQGIRKSKTPIAKAALEKLSHDPLCQKQILIWSKRDMHSSKGAGRRKNRHDEAGPTASSPQDADPSEGLGSRRSSGGPG